MGKELLLVAETLSNEKGVDKQVILEAISSAIESATRKLTGHDFGITVKLDPRTGDYETYRYWDVVLDEEQEYPDRQLTLDEAQLKDPAIAIGAHIEEIIPSVPFGRIAAQTARQVIIQKVREAERKQVVERYKAKVGQLVSGLVKKVIRDFIVIDLGGKAEALLPRSEMLPQEMFRMNDRVRAFLYDIVDHPRGPQLMVSRVRKEMLVELFRIEVPEIGENIIQIKAAARDPGSRAKIAVKTNDGRIDPIGACVGMRGARVQAVSNELGGERVDIVLWDDSPAQLVINAMSPAEITSIVVDEETKTMDLAVVKEQLSQAIGRNGQNVRLASQMTGWTLNVMNVEDFENKSQQETTQLLQLFVNALGVDEDVAELLVSHGFSSVEEIAYVPKSELLVITEFDEEIVDELRNRANNTLLAQALTGSDLHGTNMELHALEGMTGTIEQALKEKGVTTVEALADCAVDELIDIPGITEAEAGALIMKAREPWFKSEERG